MKRAIKKATDIFLLVLLYISRFICTMELILFPPSTIDPEYFEVPYLEYYIFGGLYWQELWSSFFLLICILLVDSWLFYFLSVKHHKKVVKPLLIIDLVFVFLTIFVGNCFGFVGLSRDHTWVVCFFWVLLHCLKRFLDYYVYICREREKNLMLTIFPKVPGYTYVTAYVVMILSFIYHSFETDKGVEVAGSLAVAVAMLFALTVYLSKKKAKNPQEDFAEQSSMRVEAQNVVEDSSAPKTD